MRARSIVGTAGARWITLAVAILWIAVARQAGIRADPPYTLVSTGTSLDVFASGVSADGTKVFFTTTEPLSVNDTDTARDLYMATGGVITLLSDALTGAVDANINVTYRRQTRDGLGNRVFFTTTEQLVAADRDAALDVYEASNGTVTLLTGGTQNVPADLIDGGNGDLGVSFDGSRVLFYTTEALDPVNDTDTSQDLYEASAGNITLISRGNSNGPVFFEGMTEDGLHVYFFTNAILDPINDTNNEGNIYEAYAGSFRLVTPGDLPYSGTFVSGASADGSRVILTTLGRWRPGPDEDEDAVEDCYLWSRAAGTWTLVSGDSIYPNGPDPYGNTCAAITPDGSRIYIDAAQDLSPADGNQDPAFQYRDVYLWSSGSLQLLTGGRTGVTSSLVSGAVSPDGSKLVIATNGRFAPEDTDTTHDRYLLSGGVYQLLTPGSTPVFLFGPLSPDLTRQYFTTAEGLDPSDTDGVNDAYVGSAGGATLLSPDTLTPAALAAASADGSRVFVHSQKSHDTADTDTAWDIYLVAPPSADSEPPVITFAIDAADQAAPSGWYNLASSGADGVRVHVSATDATAVKNITATASGVEVLNTSNTSGSFTLPDGQFSIAATASDGANTGAGPGSTAMPVQLLIDQTPPDITCLTAPTLTRNASATLAEVATASDVTSGPVASSMTAPLDTTTIGLRTVLVTAADLAGNSASQTCSYRVVYQFAGFGAPVNSPPNVFVTASVARNIPLSFSVSDALGPVSTLAARSVTSSVTVDPGACTGTPAGTLAASDYTKGKTGLLNGGNGNYEYQWKAPKNAVGQCQVVSLDLGDGTLHSAAFLLTR